MPAAGVVGPTSPSTSQAPATPTAQRADIVRGFKEAWEASDIDALIGLLDPDATAIADGGGVVSALLRPIEGGPAIARAFIDLAGKALDLTILVRQVNGQPGLVAEQDGVTVVVIAFDVEGGRIKNIWAVRNPESYGPGRADMPIRTIGSPPTFDARTAAHLCTVTSHDSDIARQ